MVGIKGLGGIPEPKPERPANVRGREKTEVARSEKATDDVVISNEAQAAASLAKAVATATVGDDIRAEKVQAARERIERGDYKDPEVVRQVAQRISKYLP